MKARTYLSLLLCLAVLAGLLTGCGGSSKSMGTYDQAAAEMEVEEPAARADSSANGALTEEGASADLTTQAPESRKWIVTVDISAETEDLDGVLTALEETIRTLGG